MAADATKHPSPPALLRFPSMPPRETKTRILVTGQDPDTTAKVAHQLRTSGISAEVVVGVSALDGSFGGPTEPQRGHILPLPSDSHHAHAVLWTARLLRARVVIPTSHEELASLLTLRDAFERASILIVAPSASTVELCLDRLALHDALDGHVPVPDMCRSGTRRPIPVGEWLVRSVAVGKSGTTRQPQPEELSSGDAGEDAVFVEQLPEGAYRVDVLRETDGTITCGTPRVHEGEHGSPLMPGTMAEILTRFAGCAAKAIQLEGVATVVFHGDVVGLPMVTDILPGFAAMEEPAHSTVNLPLLALRGALRTRKARLQSAPARREQLAIAS